MTRGDDPFRDGRGGFADYPGSRPLFFFAGLAFLTLHGVFWRQIAAGVPLIPDGVERADVVLVLGQSWQVWFILAFTGALAAFFFAGAFRPRGRPDATGSGCSSSSSAGGTPDPPDRDAAPTPHGLATEPLTCYFSGTALHRVYRPHHRILVIAPAPGHHGAVAICFGCAAVLWGCVWLASRGLADHPIVAALGGAVFAAVGCLFLLGVRRHAFDLRSGTYRRSNVLRWGRTLPLARVAAVQLLTEVPRQVKGEQGRVEAYEAYQLNLVLRDAGRPRRLLLEDRDRESTAGIGRELAGFLELPLYRARVGAEQRGAEHGRKAPGPSAPPV